MDTLLLFLNLPVVGKSNGDSNGGNGKNGRAASCYARLSPPPIRANAAPAAHEGPGRVVPNSHAVECNKMGLSATPVSAY